MAQPSFARRLLAPGLALLALAAVAAVVLLTVGHQRPAQQASAPSAAPAVTPTRAANGTITVGVFGDSFGQGVAYTLDHYLPAKNRYKVADFTQANTGFTRPDVHDTTADITGKLSGRAVDVAVVDFGANDTQGMKDGAKVYPYLSADWRNLYASRVSRFIALLRAHGASKIYWVGLPRMRSDAYDGHVNDLMGFYAATMAKLGVVFVPTRELTEDHSGRFDIYLDDASLGHHVVMRTNDGIHMSMAGYRLLARPVIARIESDYPPRTN